MPTLPDKTALGQPSISAAIPGISVPVDPTGKALESLGKAVSGSGGELMAADQQADKFDAQRRFIEFQDQANDQLARAQREAPPGAPDFELQQRQQFKQAGNTFFATVPPNLRPEYASKLQQIEGQIGRTARDFEWKSADTAIDGLLSDSAGRLYNRVGAAGRPGEADDKQLVFDAHTAAQNEANGLIENAPLTAMQKEVARRNIQQKLLKAAADRLAEVDPTSAIEALSARSKAGEGPTPSPDQAALADTATRLGVSPRDLAAAISYETGGKFDPSIRGGKGNNYVGLIQFGPEERQTYGIKPGMTFAEQMPAVEAFLKDRGLAPGSGISEIYRTINGGNPNAPLNASDGNGTIAQHIENIKANHYASADKFLGAASDVPGDPRFAALPLPERTNAINKATAHLSLEKYTVEQAVKNDLASVEDTGELTNVDEARVSRVLGQKAATEWRNGREDALAVYTHTQDLYSLPDNVIQQRLDAIEPDGGEPDYARKQAIYDKVKEEADSVRKERLTDPAESVSDDPAVDTATTAVSKNPNDPVAQKALVAARMAAQEKAGIPEDLRSPITKDEAMALTVPLRRMLPGEERQVLSDLATEMQKRYGDEADTAFSYALRIHKIDAEVAKAASRIARKIGLGELPTRSDAGMVDAASELAAADKAVTGLSTVPTIDPMTGVPMSAPTGAYAVDRSGPPPPPARAIEMLRGNPDLASQFDAKYGAGSSKKILEKYPLR